MDMKKGILISLLFCSIVCVAQTSADYERRIDSLITKIDTLMQENNRLLARLDMDLSLKERYKMYKTENMYNLLKLDTRLGKVWMVQYGIKGSSEAMTIEIDDAILYGYSEQYGYNGRFELYPTNNTYNFIMLDTKTGYTYQVQWYINDANRRFVRPIY